MAANFVLSDVYKPHDHLDRGYTLIQTDTKLSSEELFSQGIKIYQTAEYQNANTTFDQVIALNPGHVAAHYYKASCLQDLQLYQEAIALYNKTLELNSKHWGALQQRGNCYRILKHNTEALADLDKSIEIDPDILYSYYIRSLIHFEFGNYQQANQDMIKAKPYAPTNEYFLLHEKKIQHVLFEASAGQSNASDALEPGIAEVIEWGSDRQSDEDLGDAADIDSEFEHIDM